MRTNTMLALAATLSVLYSFGLVVASQELHAAGFATPMPSVAPQVATAPRLPYDPPRPWHPEPVPTVAPTPVPPWWLPPRPAPDLPPAPLTLTWQDDGRAYRMAVHQRLFLDLGSPSVYASSSDTRVLRPVPRLRPLPQGGAADQPFEAVAPGWATLTATTRFRCPPSTTCVQPAIAQRMFHIVVRVDP